MPAIDRYDGPRFRVLRKYLKQSPDQSLDVLILSARYGMITANHPIPDYDQIMTQTRAAELQPAVAAEFDRSLMARERAQLDPARLLLCMGKTYVGAFDGVGEPWLSMLRSRVAAGGQGPQLARLKAWLYGDASPVNRPEVTAKQPGSVRLAGVAVRLSREEALEAIRQVLASEGGTMPQPQVWYVKVDDQAIPVKWLVSHLTGVPVQAFNTNQARAVLARLGILAEQR